MHDEQMDRRPRILDFSRRIDDVRAHRDLAWPCHAFRVTVPVRAVSMLNIFEETLLRLLEDARLDVQGLRQTTGMELHLVTLVCSRLRDYGLVTERNDLTKLGRDYVQARDREEPASEVRFVFRERVTGALLPILLEGALRFEELLDWDDRAGKAEIRTGDRRLQLRTLRAASAGVPPPPTADEVLRAARRHADLCRQYSLLRKDAARAPQVVTAQQIGVDPVPQPVFVRCRVVVPASEDEYRIGDPFGFGYSDMLFRAYETLRESDVGEQEFIRRLRDDSLTVRPRQPRDDPRAREAEAAVFDRLDRSVADHKQLFDRLRHAEREAKTSVTPPRNRDEEAHTRYYAQQAAQSYAEALETALAQIVAVSRPAACEAILAGRQASFADNGELLERLAACLGFDTAKIGHLLDVAPGRIRSLREGEIDLVALVAVCIAAAAESPEHPLRRLAVSFPDWLAFLNDLKHMRDAGAHGQTRKAGISRLQALRSATYRSIACLIPALAPKGDGRGPTRASSPSDVAHDARRQAISKLERCFGVKWQLAVGSDVAEILVQVELAVESLHSGPLPNVARIVNDLASVLQAMVHRRQAVAGAESSPAAQPAETARLRAVAAGMLPADAVLPRALSTVNKRRLDEALQGQSPSLGTAVVALLVLSRPEWLKRLALSSPKFLELAVQLIDLRRHGNRPVLMSVPDVIQLKNAVYNACNSLMEW